ncbi:hypothetical protein B0T10DRAFT_178964 [Thelonectria olida]|uniref:Uncharacterized protein n=1 Tax=Thelonectria olida TaxID=1576542 RepID=A0A9P8WGS7_9HYPO|nr:hypothetical protein B0T10DRAFT_178964 [Thelonectria olida]
MEAPLCAACVVEMEMDGVREEKVVVQRGLRRVDQVDGGLTRARWEAKRVAAHTRTHQRRPPKPTTRDNILRAGDGAGTEALSLGNAPTESHAPFEAAIWVDIFDPINNPSFKPSPLKPIPLFMQRPPALAIEAKRPQTTIDEYLQTSSHLENLRSTPRASTEFTSRATMTRLPLCQPTTPRLTPSSPTTPRPLSPHPPTLRPTTFMASYNTQPPTPPQDFDYVGPLVGPPEPRRQPFAVVREEPLKRPSSRLANSTRHVEGSSSTHQTPPEHPEQPGQSPYPRPLSVARAVSPEYSQLTSQPHCVIRSTPPQSSEYLERYKPVMTPGSRKPPLAEPRPSPAIPVMSLPEKPEEARQANGVDDDGASRVSNESRDWEKVKNVGAELRRFFIGR